LLTLILEKKSKNFFGEFPFPFSEEMVAVNPCESLGFRNMRPLTLMHGRVKRKILFPGDE